ncbi:MAG: hypothetical protein ACHQQQ_11775 [Bacteroidota bacterium]
MTKTDINKLGRKITKAAKRAVRAAIREHLDSGNPIWIMKDGIMMEIKPDRKRARAGKD